MLQKRAVYPRTFEILERLNSLSIFKGFSLAGGTALALYFGHRISVDLDFFINRPFDNNQVLISIEKEFGNDELTIINVDTNSISLIVDDVKIDVLAHQYPLVEEPIMQEKIRMYGVKDIAAMKLNAIANRGTKKDFFDIYEILKHFSLSEILSFYKLKYLNNDIYYIVRSLTYFVDAEENLNPIMIGKYDWENVKDFLKKQIESFTI